MPSHDIKIVANRGDGDPPLEWTMVEMNRAHAEAGKLLSESQYEYMKDQFRELGRHPNPTRSETLDLDQVEDFFELRDWGGELHPLNLRVYYGVDQTNRILVILGVMDKCYNGALRSGDKARFQYRWRQYLRGELTILTRNTDQG